ncbi:MAG: hypothetical protein DRQ55_17990 [Planctomycetota bacterium]|nr:MAG: hypothetical protein DRQ55_17990 [Planctomycetota bacterium]
MMTRHLMTALVAVALCPSAGAQQFVLVPDSYSCSDVTPDGRIVVGWGDGGVFWWDWKTDPDPVYIGGVWATAVSDDGLTILGSAEFPPGSGDSFAAIWTLATGWQSLGTLGTCGSNSSPSDLSGDGKVAVGLTWAGCSGQGFRWTAATGMQPLAMLANGQNRAKTTNDDGSVIGGFAQGNFSRTPSLWAGDLTGFAWDADALGEVSGMNNDGTTLLGQWDGQAFILDSVSFTQIGSLNSGWNGCATEISEDGNLIGGHDFQGLGKQAWLWKQAVGFVSMDDVVLGAGVLDALPILSVSGMSDDGNVLVGNSGSLVPVGTPGGFSGYIFEFDTDGTWADLGNGLAGATGVPALVGGGPLLPFATVELNLSNALPGGQGWLVAGLSALNAPFNGGILIPNFDALFGPLAIDGAGEIALSSFWPANVPSAFTTYFQYWIPDATGVQGFAASNGVSATTP